MCVTKSSEYFFPIESKPTRFECLGQISFGNMCVYVKHISIINLYHLICHEILMCTLYSVCTDTHGTNKFKLEHLDVNDVNRTGQMRKLKPYYRVNRTTTSTSTTATLQMRLHNLNPITLAINRI